MRRGCKRQGERFRQTGAGGGKWDADEAKQEEPGQGGWERARS